MTNKTTEKKLRRERRHARVRARVVGTADRPRLCVFRSNRFLYAQLIDDTGARTIAAADTRSVEGSSASERASAVGKALALKAKEGGVTKAVFDRGGFLYAGSIKAIAEGAREAGLEL